MKQMELQQILGERVTNLNRGDLTDEEFTKEVERTKTMAAAAKEMVRNAALMISAKKSVGAMNSEFVEKLI